MASKSFLALALGAALLLSGPTGFGPSDALAQCMSQSEARAAVASGQAVDPSSIVGRLRREGQVVSACLAPGGGGLVYVVSLVKPNGEVTQVVVNARTGR